MPTAVKVQSLDHRTTREVPRAILLFFFLIILFIFGCAGSSLLHGLFSSYREQGLLSSYSGWASLVGTDSRAHGLQ